MSNIIYRIIDEAHSADINIVNEPFPVYGRMIPSLSDGKWDYREVLFPAEEIEEMRFPDENYRYHEMIKDHAFIGAYDGEKCIGLAILADDWFKYMYLDDLKVNAAYRRMGVGHGLIEASMALAKERNYRGLYTIGQDNNLNACRFYLSCGFEIGGFNSRVYRGTKQEGKSDIYFYKEG